MLPVHPGTCLTFVSSRVLGPELGYTYTYVKTFEHNRIEIDAHMSPPPPLSSGIDGTTNTNTHICENDLGWRIQVQCEYRYDQNSREFETYVFLLGWCQKDRQQSKTITTWLEHSKLRCCQMLLSISSLHLHLELPVLELPFPLGLEKGLITKGVFSMEESLESLTRSWSDCPCFPTL